MTLLLRGAFLTLYLFILAGCASYSIPNWRYFQGNLSGQGYMPVESGFAVSSAWTSSPYKITSSSPVIGIDVAGREVIYFGTVDGELIAINSEDGSERWRRSFASPSKAAHIVSTPAVSLNGDIYIVTNHPHADGRVRSILHKIDEFSRIRWSFAVANDGFTSGAPKILKWGQDTLIFVYVTVVADGDPQGALLALRDNGKSAELLDRKALGHCRWDSAALRDRKQDVINSLSVLWDFISVFPIETAESAYELPDMFVDPTVAVFADRKLPLIAIADNLCSLGVYEWDKQLSIVWQEFHPHQKHSSAVLLPNGLMVFGRQDGMVLGYDVETGIQLWTHDAGQPVLATPAATPESHLYLIAKDRILVLDQQDGTPVYDGASARNFNMTDQTYSSPVVSKNCVYVSAGAMLTFSRDLSTRSQDTNFRGNALASIALGNKGAIYAVAADGTIRKYLGPK